MVTRNWARRIHPAGPFRICRAAAELQNREAKKIMVAAAMMTLYQGLDRRLCVYFTV
jgi:hypothetical protein